MLQLGLSRSAGPHTHAYMQRVSPPELLGADVQVGDAAKGNAEEAKPALPGGLDDGKDIEALHGLPCLSTP